MMQLNEIEESEEGEATDLVCYCNISKIFPHINFGNIP